MIDELKTHVLYEFMDGRPNRDNIIMEERGVVGGMSKVVECLSQNMIAQLAFSCDEGEDSVETYSGKISDDGTDTFFDNYTIELSFHFSDGSYNGGTVIPRSFSDTEKGIECHPYIYLHIYDTDLNSAIYKLRFCLGHELTHVYNMLQYAIKYGLKASSMMTSMALQNYPNIAHGMKSYIPNEKAIADICYKLNRMERNAYIAQLKQELEEMSDTIIDSHTATEAIKRTESYKKYKNLERNVEILCSDNISEKAKQEIIKYTNSIMMTYFTTYKQVVKYYLGRWDRWKKKYLSTAAKIVHDIYDEHNAVIGGFNNDNTLLGND